MSDSGDIYHQGIQTPRNNTIFCFQQFLGVWVEHSPSWLIKYSQNLLFQGIFGIHAALRETN